MSVGAVLDLMLITMLGFAAGGGMLIHRKLERLSAAQEELKAALILFDDASSRAEAAMRRLETGGMARGTELNAAAKRAEALIAELSVIASAGDRIATRIEGAIREVKALAAANASRNSRRAA